MAKRGEENDPLPKYWIDISYEYVGPPMPKNMTVIPDTRGMWAIKHTKMLMSEHLAKIERGKK